jgi:hypothetical protein
MTKVKEYVEIEGKRIAVTAENLIKAHKKMWQMQEELDSLRDSVYYLEHRFERTFSL